MKMHMLFVTLFSVFTTTALIFASDAAQTGDLKLGLEKGKTYRTRTIVDQDVKQTMQGQEMKMKQKMTNDMSFEVKEVDAIGNMTVLVTFERVAAEMQAGPRTMSYDSAEPSAEGSPLAKSLGAMVGQSYTVVLTDRGEMVGVTGMESLVSQMVENMGVQDEAMKAKMKKQFEDSFNEQSAKDMCGQMFGMLPPGQVAIGDQWSCSSNSKMIIPVAFDQTWVLKEIRDDVFVIEGEATTSIHSGEEPTEMGPMKVFMDMEGTQSGTMELDKKTGLVVGGKMHSTIKGEQRFADGPAELKGQVIPMEMEQTMTWQPL